ncbi:MAG: phosphate/phosphite/phosphonate ABC transporter substrate-binding protein [Armatimonadota bacterium]
MGEDGAGEAQEQVVSDPRHGSVGNPPRLSPVMRVAFVILVCVLAAVVVYGVVATTRRNLVDPRFAPSHWVSLEDGNGAEHPGGSGGAARRLPLRVAVAPVISPERSLTLYRGLVDYLGDALGREPAMLQRRSYAEINDLVRHGWCDVAFVCTYAFVRGEREFGMEALVVPVVGGETTYHSFIIVPSSSEARSLLDLKGKRFASSDLLSNSGWLFPVTWLDSNGQDPKRFFSKHLITGSHDVSVEAVMTGYADGAAVDSVVYEHMAAADESVKANTKVIMKSPRFGMPPVVVHPRIEPELKSQLLEALLRMHTDPKGQQALSPLHIDRFVQPDDAMYDGVRRAADALESP